MKTPACAGVFMWIAVASGGACVVPGNSPDLRPRNADIGKLAIIEASEFTHALIVAPPRPDEPDQTGNQHGGHPFFCCGQFGRREGYRREFPLAARVMLRCS